MTVDMVKNYQVEDMYDVIVGRNFTLTELKRQYPGRPVIGIPVAKYDVVRAVCEMCIRDRYNRPPAHNLLRQCIERLLW